MNNISPNDKKDLILHVATQIESVSQKNRKIVHLEYVLHINLNNLNHSLGI